VAFLGGTADVRLIGDYRPEVGDTFTVLSAARIDGAFATLRLPDLGPDRQLRASYDSVSLTLTTGAAGPGDRAGMRAAAGSLARAEDGDSGAGGFFLSAPRRYGRLGESGIPKPSPLSDLRT